MVGFMHRGGLGSISRATTERGDGGGGREGDQYSTQPSYRLLNVYISCQIKTTQLRRSPQESSDIKPVLCEEDRAERAG